MELHQLEYLVAVADEQGFTRAAQKVHVSQSGISAQIRKLERELGATLFDRGSRSASPTDAGDVAISRARRILDEVAALAAAVDEVGGLVRGRLDIGMVTACSVGALFGALSQFHLAHPGVEISLTEGHSNDLVARVRAGALDAALVGVAAHPPEGLEAHIVYSDMMVAGVPFGHHLASRATVTLTDVCAHAVLCLPRGNGTRAVFDGACEAQGLSAEISFQASAPETVAELAARGLGIAVLSESSVPQYSDRLAFPRIVDVGVPALLALVWNGGGSPALRTWLDFARAEFGDPPAS